MEHAKQEVLRYLGRRGQAIPPQIDSLIDDSMTLIRKCTPRHIDRTYGLHFQDTTIRVDGTLLTLPGTAIRRHLSGCRQVVLMASTLGTEADTMIRRWEALDMTRALILDACATQYIEHCCAEIEQRVRRQTQGQNIAVTSRFSPGYGDLPLDIQPPLLAALDAERRIGLTCTQNLILLPRKSVTALIGLSPHPLPAETAAISGTVISGTGAFTGTTESLTSETLTPETQCTQTPGSSGCSTCSLRSTCPFCEHRP